MKEAQYPRLIEIQIFCSGFAEISEILSKNRLEDKNLH
jgi:hypothetical protein